MRGEGAQKKEKGEERALKARHAGSQSSACIG